MIRLRMHPAIALGLVAFIGVLILTDVLPGGPGYSAPTVPSVVVPARPSVKVAQESPDRVAAVDGTAPGEPHQVQVDATKTAREGDVELLYVVGTETDRGLQVTVQVSSPTEPADELLLYSGDQFEFGGYVFEVNEQTNAWRLVLDVSTSA